MRASRMQQRVPVCLSTAKLLGRTTHFAIYQHPPKTNKPILQVKLLSSFKPAMQKTQLVALVAVLLALVFSSSDAIPCRYCDQQTCRNACLDDLKWCYEWEKENHKKTKCLSFYYICGAGCAFSPRAAGDSPEDFPAINEELPTVDSSDFDLPENDTAELTQFTSD
jgi:hypothetical protein